MCQISPKGAKLTILKEDMEVWKTIVCLKKKNIVLSYYRVFHYKLGKTYAVKIKDVLNSCTNPTSISVGYHVGFHSYLHRRDTQGVDGVVERVARCIIPKGSRIIRGMLQTYTTEIIPTIVSTRIKIVEII